MTEDSATVDYINKTALGGTTGAANAVEEKRIYQKRAQARISTNYLRQFRELCSWPWKENYEIKWKQTARIRTTKLLSLRFLRTLPSHLHHKAKIRRACEAEMPPALGWDWSPPGRSQLCSRCQRGPAGAGLCSVPCSCFPTWTEPAFSSRCAAKA